MTCEICGSNMKPTLQRLSAQAFLCPACKLVVLKDKDIDLETESSLDENKRAVSLENTRKSEFDITINLMKRYISENASGLDIGCSYGDFISCVQNTYRCEGIEPEASVASKASDRGFAVTQGFFPKDIHKLYDFLVFNNAFEHIRDCNALLEGCNEKTEKNGYVVITVPLTSGILYKIAKLLFFFGRTKELERLYQLKFHSPHVYYYNKDNLKMLLRKHGFAYVGYEKLNNIDVKSMKDRIMMDRTEKAAGLKAALFRIAYPILKLFPEDKGVFIFKKER